MKVLEVLARKKEENTSVSTSTNDDFFFSNWYNLTTNIENMNTNLFFEKTMMNQKSLGEIITDQLAGRYDTPSVIEDFPDTSILEIVLFGMKGMLLSGLKKLVIGFLLMMKERYNVILKVLCSLESAWASMLSYASAFTLKIVLSRILSISSQVFNLIIASVGSMMGEVLYILLRVSRIFGSRKKVWGITLEKIGIDVIGIPFILISLLLDIPFKLMVMGLLVKLLVFFLNALRKSKERIKKLIERVDIVIKAMEAILAQ